MRIVIDLDDISEKCLRYVLIDPELHLRELVDHMVARGAEDLYKDEVERLMADPDTKTIPADRDLVIAQAKVPSAAERYEQQQQARSVVTGVGDA